MIAPMPTRDLVKELKVAGFTSRDGKGSHTVRTCSHGDERVTVPTGHRTVSPGVIRQVRDAVKRCEEGVSK